MTAPDGQKRPPSRPASFRQVFTAVLWSFFGVRKRRMLEQDASTLRPHHVIIAGLATAAIFVIVLIVVVNLIVRAAG